MIVQLIGRYAPHHFQVQAHCGRLESLPGPAPRVAFHSREGVTLPEAECNFVTLRESCLHWMIAMSNNRSGWSLKRSGEFSGSPWKPKAEFDPASGGFACAESSKLNALVDYGPGGTSGCLG